MKIINPDPLTVSQLNSSNVSIEAISPWVAGSYSQGEQVIHNTIIWEALKTTSLEPLGTDFPGINTADWLWVGYINKWRMFRDGRDSKTIRQNLITANVTPQGPNRNIIFFGLQGIEARVTISDGVTNHYEFVKSLQEPEASNLFELFTTPAVQKETLVIEDIIPQPNVTYQIEIEATTGADAACGRVVLGNEKDIGLANYDTRVSALSASVARRDELLGLTLLKRRTVRTVDFNVTVPSSRVEYAQRTLETVDGVVTVFIGDEKYGSTIALGIVRDFSINIAGPVLSDATLRTEDF